MVTDLTDIDALRGEQYNISNADRIATNSGYGHMYMLRKYAGLDPSCRVNAAIEHGYYTDDYVFADEVYHPCNRVITMSPYRKHVIENVVDNCSGISIGPYIAYAEDYYSSCQLKELKDKWRSPLLIFPKHSLRQSDTVYDAKALIDEAMEIANCHNFKTIFACFHYLDLDKEYINIFRGAGCVIISPGADIHTDFMSRLKSILSVSDAILVNTCTTGIIYAMFLGKKVFISKQDACDKVRIQHTRFRNSAFTHGILDVINEKCSADFRKRWLDYYFGFSDIKSRKEIADILTGGIRIGLCN